MFIASGTFDVQSVDITWESDEYINITCHFAQGSLIRGCIIVTITQIADGGRHKSCELIATREEGHLEALIQVVLPAGQYIVVVYDDEEVAVRNAAYITTLMISNSSLTQNLGMRSVRKGIR